MGLWWAVLTLVGCLLAPAPSATADGGTNAVGACLAADEVWLLVVGPDDTVLANQCVGNPRSGEDALRAGGMAVRHARNGVICSLSDHPPECPRTFRGQYWHYYHAAPGAPYDFSDLGAKSYRVPAGTIEAWCYNAEGEKKCTPPELSILIDGQQLSPAEAPANLAVTTNEPVRGVTGDPWTLVVTVGVLAGGGVGFWFWHRRNRPA